MKTNKESSVLLIDVGNSYLKWVCLVDGELSRFGNSRHDGVSLPSEAMATWSAEQPARVLVSNVAGQLLEHLVVQWFEQQWRLSPEFVSVESLSAYGLKTTYADPSRLGVDRALALVAARHWAPVCVVDCGTAVTMDVLSCQNVHLGGAVFPGLALMRDALLGKASGVRQGMVMPEASGGTNFLGQDTFNCVAQGACFAVAGGIARYLDEITQNLGEYRCIMTGGDALAIQSMLKDGYHVVPNLVLRGLQIVADQK